MVNILITSFAGAAAGIINGFIGTGGGIVLILIFSKTMKTCETKDIFATVIAAILPMSIVSAVSYYMQGNVPIKETAVYIIPAIAGGIIGALLLDKIKTDWLKLIFSGLVVFAGVKMIW